MSLETLAEILRLALAIGALGFAALIWVGVLYLLASIPGDLRKN